MKTISLKAIPLALALVATAACGVKKQTTDISPSISRAPTCEDAIATYATRSDVPTDYYELAYVEAEGNSVYTTDNKLQENIRNAAAKVGATAVIANPVEQSKTTVKILGEAVASKSATQKASALAIYQPSERDRVVATCGK
mgnify:CR=1 FL=1|jgi:hypothetical protein